MKKFAEFDTSGEQLEGEKTKKEDLLGKEFEIHKWVELTSQANPNETFFVIQGKLDGKFITFTSGLAIKNQLNKVGIENMPIEAKLEQRKNKQGRDYYLLV